jgi:hypothetical protein
MDEFASAADSPRAVILLWEYCARAPQGPREISFLMVWAGPNFASYRTLREGLRIAVSRSKPRSSGPRNVNLIVFGGPRMAVISQCSIRDGQRKLL